MAKEKPDKLIGELNRKIESLMGPTPDGGKPVDEEKDGKLPSHTTPKNEPKKRGAPEVPKNFASQIHPKPSEEYIGNTKNKGEQNPTPVTDDNSPEKPDDLLAKEEDDQVVAAFLEKGKEKRGGQEGFLKKWWGSKTARRWTLGLSFVLLLVLGAVPSSRYFLLNTLGVRVSASVVVLDQSTKQPLKNVNVSIGNATVPTNETGTATLVKLKLGKNNLQIEKRAFAKTDKNIVLGWGSNPLGDYQLTPTGVQYTYILEDFLSDKPIEKAEASAGDASAYSDQTGKVVVTIAKEDVETTKEVTIVANGYRTETLTLGDKTDAVDIAMAPSKQLAFISKRSGKYDLYKIDMDGKNEKLVLAGTGSENENISVVPHPVSNSVALVSTRSGQRNQDGFLLSSLLVIDLSNPNKTSKSIAKAELIQVIGWVGNRLVYVQVASGESADNPKRHRLMSYNSENGENKELAATNYFNDVLLANDIIFFAPAASENKKADIGLYSILADGSTQKRIFEQETWNIYRTDFHTLTFAVGQDWYNLTIGSDSPSKADGPPAIQKTRIYANSPNKDNSIWVDQRDGKGTLLAYNIGEKSEVKIHEANGLKYPVSWGNNSTIVYRMNTESETADYVISTDGGKARKVADVTNTDGVDAWYYY